MQIFRPQTRVVPSNTKHKTILLWQQKTTTEKRNLHCSDLNVLSAFVSACAIKCAHESPYGCELFSVSVWLFASEWEPAFGGGDGKRESSKSWLLKDNQYVSY